MAVSPHNLRRENKAATLASRQITARIQWAMTLHNQGRLSEAQAIYKDILQTHPNHFESLHLMGVSTTQSGHYKLALKYLDKAIRIEPGSARAHSNRGIALMNLNRLSEALASYDKALKLKPDYPEAHNNRGTVLKKLSRLDEAIVSYEKAISVRPDYVDAYINLGNALSSLERQLEALVYYDKALSIKPDSADAYNNRGSALFRLKRVEDALASFDQAIALRPDYAEAHNNRGSAMLKLRQWVRAIQSIDKALEIKPKYLEAWINRGNALLNLGRLGEALEILDKAIQHNSSSAQAYYLRGMVLGELHRLKDSLKSYRVAISLNPDEPFLQISYLHARMQLCDWTSLSDDLARLKTELLESKTITSPFALLSLLDCPKLQKSAAETYVIAKYPKTHLLSPLRSPDPDNKIRVGYYSADFRNHPVSYLIAELIEKHHRDRFEIYGISFITDPDDAMFQRLSVAFDRFLDVADKDDQEVVLLSRELKIDIAVDLGGYTRHSRTGIFAEGCAPIQVQYLGYPGTMGAPYMDYIIADRYVIPPEQRRHYSEQVVYLPDCFQANDANRPRAESPPTREAMGLPTDGFVFCCFNAAEKISPDVFALWMRLLQAVPGSVLWLKGGECEANLRREAAARGVVPERLVFAPLAPYAEYLARYTLADLFLDTLPFNAGTTASDALWTGLPVLTCSGQAFAARMAGSLLHAIGLPELITDNLADYEALALDLARHRERLAALRNRLLTNRLTHPLFDTDRFSRHIEAAYITMWERCQRGELPVGFAVEPNGPGAHLRHPDG